MHQSSGDHGLPRADDDPTSPSAPDATTSSYDVVIVGAGQAGSTVATELRARGFAGSIVLIGDEPVLPYERPPLSKAYLTGDVSAEQLVLRDQKFWTSADITLALRSRVVAVDPATRRVDLDSGRSIDYGSLVWAAGGEPRRLGLDGEQLDGVHVLRTVADADRLRVALAQEGGALAVVGAGFVGLETAAAFATHGFKVRVIEFQDRVLKRVAGEVISAHVHRIHEDHGVEVLLNTQVVALTGDDSRVSGVQVLGSDGVQATVPADHVLVAVGLVPSTAVLEAAGATISDGVVVDGFGRTSLSGVYAVGDCANFPYELHPRGRVRLESVQGATELAKLAAADIAGAESRAFPTPWFWSNQYDLKFKTVGISTGYDTAICRGEPSSGSFSVLYLKDDLLLAVDTINHMRDYVGARPVVGQRLHLGRASDTTIKLTEAVATP